MRYPKPSPEQLGWIKEFWNARELSHGQGFFRMVDAVKKLEETGYLEKGMKMPSLDTLYAQHDIL